MAIASIEDLRRHLKWAVELERGTLPPYLDALYSIEEGRPTPAHPLVCAFVAVAMARARSD